MGGDGGDSQVAIISDDVNNKVSHYFYSSQKGWEFTRKIIINGASQNEQVIQWLNGKMPFTPTVAINKKNPNKIAVQYVDKTQSPQISKRRSGIL